MESLLKGVQEFIQFSAAIKVQIHPYWVFLLVGFCLVLKVVRSLVKK